MMVSIDWLESALAVLWVGWIIYWVVGEPLYQYAKHESKAALKLGGGRRNILSYVFLMAAFGILEISFTGRLALLGEGFLPDVEAVWLVGFVLAIAGLAFSVWARVYLGSNWSPIAMLKKGQTLVRTGPYGVVRHPIYLGLIIAIIGTALVYGGYRVIISIVCVFLFAWVRIIEEEKLMSNRFGEDYTKYKKEVKAIIPGII
jgi:protein-S-isoprenylcysteine O-methyltransferase Ste14